MAPKRGKANAAKRNEETQRLPGDERAPAASASPATAALDRRPHHLVSRLHPPWNAPGSSAGNGSNANNQTARNSAAASAPLVKTAAAKTVAPLRGRTAAPPLTTRVGGRAGAVARDDGRHRPAHETEDGAKGTGRVATASAATTARGAVGQKRSRSPAASSSSESDVEDSSTSEDGSRSSSVSLSPSAVVTESKVLHSSAVGNGSKAVMEQSTSAKSSGRDTTKLTSESSGTAQNSSSGTGTGDAVVDSGEADTEEQLHAPHAQGRAVDSTLVSTAESNLLFHDDDDEDERNVDDGNNNDANPRYAVPQQQGARAGSGDGASPDPFLQPPDHLLETALLGDFSQRVSMTPARGPRHVDDLLGELPQSTDGRGLLTDSQPQSPGTRLLGGGSPPDGERTPNADAAAAVAAHFAETLAVQDLSLLPDDGTHLATPSEQSPILADSLEPNTPRGDRVTDGGGPHGPKPREGMEEGDEEVLLGDGLVSPPVKRVTATPREVAESAAAAKGGTGPRALTLPPPFPTDLNAVSTSSTSESAHAAHAAAAADDSLASTVDDGCWKEEAQTPLRTPPLPPPPSQLHAAALRGTAAALQETVPIDPYVSTVSQYQRGKEAQAAEVIVDDSDATTTAATTEQPVQGRRVNGKGVGAQRTARSASKASSSSSSPARAPSRPPTSGPPPPEATNVDEDEEPRQTTAPTIAGGSGVVPCSGDVDPVALVVGARVEGRWGRQWYAATVSEAPRNGFVQIKWEEDGSLLHVRLREVRLSLSLATPATAPADKAKKTDSKVSSTAARKTQRGAAEEAAVMTATQLVALMDEEDAEDSRHEAEVATGPRNGASFLSTAATREKGTQGVKRTLDEQDDAHGENNGDETEEGQDEPEENVGSLRGRKRSRARTSPQPPLSRHGATPPPPPSVKKNQKEEDEQQQQQTVAGIYDLAGQVPPAEVSDAPLPLEASPSALCLYLPPSVRKELLQGSCCSNNNSNSSGGGLVASSEVQRNTEMQRVLHYLVSAGATLVSSLAQADNMAAQIGDGEANSSSYSSALRQAPSALKKAGAGLQDSHTHLGDDSSFTGPTTHSASAMGIGGGSSNSSGAAVRRKTVGRVPLPRRSGVHPTPVSGAARSAVPLRKLFIFLVAPEAASSTSGAANSEEEAARASAVVRDVCAAHALGVSAIHASWLWTIAPGALHVRLPTAQDQVFLALPDSPQGQVAVQWGSRCAPGCLSAAPLRLRPVPYDRRWLSGKAVEFVERDDAMELWLNAAGAVVTAEPLPPPPAQTAAASPAPVGPPQTQQPVSPTGSTTDATAAGKAGSSSALAALAAVVTQRRSTSPAHHASPPRKQPCLERRPDFVYVPEECKAAVADLSRLADVPVLQLEWFVRGVEHHYRLVCDAAEPEDDGDAALDVAALPRFSAVWAAMRRAAVERSQGRSGGSLSPPVTAKCAPRVPAAAGAASGADERQASKGKETSEGAEWDGSTTPAPVAAVGPEDARSPDAKDPTTTEGGPASRVVGPPATSTVHVEVREADRATTHVKAQIAGSVVSPRGAQWNQDHADGADRVAGDDRNAISTRAGESRREGQEIDAMGAPHDSRAYAAGSAALVTPAAAPFVPHAFCCHQPVQVGEDYYVSLPMPATSVMAATQQLQAHSPLSYAAAPQQVVPTPTVALCRVMAVLKTPTEDLCASSYGNHHNDEDKGGEDGSPGMLPCCQVLLRLYDIKDVAMHHDPRTRELVPQYTVYLSLRSVVVPPAALLFDLPAYVVTRSSLQHVYVLDGEEQEDEGEGRAPEAVADVHSGGGCPSSSPSGRYQSHMSAPLTAAGPPGNPTTVRHHAAVVSPHVGFRDNASRAGDAQTTPQLPPQDATVSASPAPVSPLPLRMLHTTDSAVRRWAMSVADPLPLSTPRSPTAPPAHAGVPDRDGHAARLAAGDAGPAAVRESLPETLEVDQLPERSPLSAAAAARRVVQGIGHGAAAQQRVLLGTAPRPARLLAQLPLTAGGRTVVVRPGSHVTFYARRSLSVAERRPSRLGRLSTSLASRADSPSDFPLATTDRCQRRAARDEKDGDEATEDSDDSEELVAEAPLLGRVELMREMDGMVDIVVHTAQPNSVFGGSKMYRVTPDMIVDASEASEDD